MVQLLHRRIWDSHRRGLLFAVAISLTLLYLGLSIVPESRRATDFEIAHDLSGSSTATSGKLFSGNPINSFLLKNRIFSRGARIYTPKPISQSHLGKTCKKWSVVTTIFEPSDAIKLQASLGESWCLVIVGDKKSPSNYSIEGATSHVVYLNSTDQESFALNLNPSGLASALPWNHFGRKNVGYL